MSKIFQTYNEQMKCLRNKGILCSETKDKTTLIRCGYFNLFNGYKTPFVSGYNSSTSSHIYYSSTSINSIKTLYEFDEELRILLFKYLTKVENEIRTIAGYKFDDLNISRQTWFDIESYDHSLSPVVIIETISKAYSEISQSNNLEYVNHYMTVHNTIPTWIFVKVIKFQTFIKFISNCTGNFKDCICNLYNIFDSLNRPDHNLLINMLYWIKKVRNSCAHNERLYTLRKPNSRLNEKYMLLMPPSYSRDRDQKIFDALVYLKYFLDVTDYNKLIDDFYVLINNLSKSISQNAFDNVRANLGIKRISDLSILKTKPNQKNYNKF